MQVLNFFKTTVGKKIAMALSGLVLVGFVIGHMIGNLKIFGGAPHGAYKIDLYGEFLREVGSQLFGEGGLLWMVRIVLLFAVLVHAWSGITLSSLHRRAKPIHARNPEHASSNAASRTMLYGGLLLICFIIFHILHFTTGDLHFRGFQHGKVYSNVWLGFQSSAVVGFYLISMLALCMHLYHGIWSMFQTLGVTSPLWTDKLKLITKTLSILIFIGFVSVPLAVAFNILPAPTVGVQVSKLNELAD